MIDLRGRNFLSTLDFSHQELCAIVDLALRMKRDELHGTLPGKVIALLFFNPSVRTRVSCEAAMAKMGGHAITLNAGKDTWNFEHGEAVVMDGNTQEHVRELAPVLTAFVDAVGIRKSELITSGSDAARITSSYKELKEDVFLHRFAQFANKPVINLESNSCHPLQGLADMATLREKLGAPRGKKYVLTWAYHPKPLPVATPHSQLLAAAQLGMNITILRPEGYDLDGAVMEAAQARAAEQGGSLQVTDNIDEAYDGAQAVCAKSWGALDYYGRFEEEARMKLSLKERWIVDRKKMARTDDAIFMHCLPVRRNVIVTDGVIDAPRSAVQSEAENRLWTVSALLQCLLGS